MFIKVRKSSVKFGKTPFTWMGHKYFLVPEAGENSETSGRWYEISLEVSSYFGSTCEPDTGPLMHARDCLPSGLICIYLTYIDKCIQKWFTVHARVSMHPLDKET